MSLSIQFVPRSKRIQVFLNSAKEWIWISSPFLTSYGAHLIEASECKCRIITKVTASNATSFALDLDSLARLIMKGVEIRSIPNLHAKIYLKDGKHGIVTSSNLTEPGLTRNVEFGIDFVNEPTLFSDVLQFYEDLWEKATEVTIDVLSEFNSNTAKLSVKNGVWKSRISEVQDEPIVPSPVVGKYDIVVQETSETNIQEGFHVSDEAGDILLHLPFSADKIIRDLSGSEEKTVQGYLNTLTNSA